MLKLEKKNTEFLWLKWIYGFSKTPTHKNEKKIINELPNKREFIYCLCLSSFRYNVNWQLPSLLLLPIHWFILSFLRQKHLRVRSIDSYNDDVDFYFLIAIYPMSSIPRKQKSNKWIARATARKLFAHFVRQYLKFMVRTWYVQRYHPAYKIETFFFLRDMCVS